jgi:predicted GIY-YIG superfamily endonuclease
MFYVYVLKNNEDNNLYTGFTVDLKKGGWKNIIKD